MIKELKNILKSDGFRVWLNNPKLWDTLNVDYHPPHVERVWTGYDNHRISLHVIHPCEEGEALLHPHPWKSAMYILPIGGRYEHGIGSRFSVDHETQYAHLDDGSALLSKQEYKGDVYYEILHEDATHYVRPIGLPVYTIMISGPVIWPDNKTEETKDKKELKPLSEERKQEILNIFKTHFE